jgi:protein TonB
MYKRIRNRVLEMLEWLIKCESFSYGIVSIRTKIAVWLLAAVPLLACCMNPAETRDEPEEKPATSQPTTSADTPDATAMRLRLEDEIAEKTRFYNQHPHRRYIGANTQEYRFARYFKYWRVKTERIARLNYPREARGKMYDTLVVTVSVKKDGSIEKVVINRPSKYSVLNEAVERIVRLGEPYAPFSPEIARDTDVLDITSSWTFTNNPLGNQPASE